MLLAASDGGGKRWQLEWTLGPQGQGCKEPAESYQLPSLRVCRALVSRTDGFLMDSGWWHGRPLAMEVQYCELGGKQKLSPAELTPTMKKATIDRNTAKSTQSTMAGIAITSNGKSLDRGMSTGVGVDRGMSERLDPSGQGLSMMLSNPKNVYITIHTTKITRRLIASPVLSIDGCMTVKRHRGSRMADSSQQFFQTCVLIARLRCYHQRGV